MSAAAGCGEGGGEDGHVALARFEAERRRLFAIAYRMLGSVSDAEDVLQDAFLRWQRVAQSEVGNPPAYLAQLVTRLCLNALASAHRRRVEYVGPWLPEPLVGEVTEPAMRADRPDELQELSDELSLALLVLLERLTPPERAVFVLRESFGFEYRDIAPLVGKTEANCRQIDRRARRHLAHARGPAPGDRETHRRLVDEFLRAMREGNVDGLLRVLARDVVAYADGGGRVVAARRPVEGAALVARYLTGLVAKARPGTELSAGRVNGEPGVLTYAGGRLHNVIALYVQGGAIARIFIVANPAKLRLPS